MARQANWPPSIYPKNAAPGVRTFCRISENGKQREVPLGPSGTEQAKAAYAKLCAELAEHNGKLPPPTPATDPTINDCCLAFMAHLESTGKREAINYRPVLKALGRLHGTEPAKLFGPKKLKKLLRAIASGSWMTPEEQQASVKNGRRVGQTQGVANRNLMRIKSVFKWLQSEEMIPSNLYHDLLTVEGLESDEADETEDVMPVPEDTLAQTLPHMRRVTQAVARLQLLTAGRPTEILRLRLCDLLRSGQLDLGKGNKVDLKNCWAYTPKQHKMRKKGRKRILLFGPEAQAVLKPFLEGRAPEAYLFSALEASEEYRADRKQIALFGNGRSPGDCYTVASYRRSIKRACDRAFSPPPELLPTCRKGGRKASWKKFFQEHPEAKAALDTWKRDHRWNPYRLRHNAATRINEQFGLEIARIILGHKKVETTLIYALENIKKAIDAMEQAG